MKFQQGLSNTTILKNKIVIQKINHDNDLFLNRINLIKILSFLNTTNFKFCLKQKINFQNSNLIIVTKYLKNTHFLTKNNLNKQTIQKIAKAVKKLHTISFKGFIKYNWKTNLTDFKKNSLKFLKPLQNKEQKIKILLKNYAPKNFVLCHNDLVINNILLKKKQIFLIDYEFACLNDYLFDIASFISETITFLITNKKQKQDLIFYWIKQFKLSKSKIKMVYKLVVFQNLLNCYWANFMFFKTKQNIFKTIFEFKYQKLENQINSISTNNYEW